MRIGCDAENEDLPEGGLLCDSGVTPACDVKATFSDAESWKRVRTTNQVLVRGPEEPPGRNMELFDCCPACWAAIGPLLLISANQRAAHAQSNDERETGRQEVLDKVIPVALRTGHAVKITVRELLAAMAEDDQRERLD